MVTLDEETQKKIKPLRYFERDAQLIVERNRWFLVSMVLAVIALSSMLMAYLANQKAISNIKVAWVKMLPSGTWETDFFDEGREAEFFPATIDYMIRQFIEKRFSKQSKTIADDYSCSTYVMGKELYHDFYHEFNAPQVAIEHEQCLDCAQTQMVIRAIHHYDSHDTKVGKYTSNSYRTNVHATEVMTSSEGQMIKKMNKLIALHWRLKTKQEIQSKKDALKYNPIGLEILSVDIQDDLDVGASSS